MHTEKIFLGAMKYQSILLPSELESLFRRDRNDVALEVFSEYRDGVEAVYEAHDKVDSGINQTEIIYVSKRIWVLYQVIVRVHGRMAVLVGFSLRDKRYHDWRTDGLMLKNLEEALPPEIVEDAKKSRIGGLPNLIAELKAQFILEARSIIGGSEMFKDSLTEIFDALKSNVEEPHNRDRLR